MSRYAIGDVQGCLKPLQRLLDRLPLRSEDTLWFAGDLVNRGPDSLGVLRLVQGLGKSARVVLGNHDLHLLSLAEGFGKPRADDTLDAILNASDRDSLLHWLRHQALAIAEDGFLMVHAGVLPQWSVDETCAFAGEVEKRLQSGEFRDLLRTMYGNEPSMWSDDLSTDDRHRLIINALTRLRVCTPEGRLDLSFKGEAANIPENRLPWFDVPDRKTVNDTLIFGHWSALGLILRDKLIGVDTGCVWGRELTAVRLEDRAVFTVPA